MKNINSRKIIIFFVIVSVVGFSVSVILYINIFFNTKTTNDVVWNKYYYFDRGSEGGYIEQVANHLLVIGYSNGNLILLKLTDGGNLLSNRTYGGIGEDYGRSILPLDDGYLIVGSTESYGRNGSMDAWLVKVDREGNEIWNRTYGGYGYDEGTYALHLDDGYLIVGSTESYGRNGSMDAWLVKVDREGNEIWNRTYGGYGYDEFRSAALCGENIIVVGMTSSYSKDGNWDAWLVKVDREGNEIWNRTYGGNLSDLFNDVIVDNDKIISVGHTEVSENRWFGMIVCVDKDGNKIFEKKIDSNMSTGLSSVTNLGGYYYSVGYEGVFGMKRDNLLLVKFNDRGRIIWRKTFGGKFEDAGVWICGNDHSLYITGYSERDGDSRYSVWVLKFRIH